MSDFSTPTSEWTSPGEPASGSLADLEVLQQRADDLGKDCIDDPLLKRLIATFIEDARDTVPEVKRDATKGNLEAVRSTTHRLKGGAATVGAEAFVSLCQSIERAARQERTADVRRGVKELSVLLERTVEKYRRVVGTLSK